jgi:hypothetical protein
VSTSNPKGGQTRGEGRTRRRPEAVRAWPLGGFKVSVGSETIEDVARRLRKTEAVMKLLALSPGRRLHREQVMDYLWPHLSREAAANSLGQAWHAARRVLAPTERHDAEAPEGRSSRFGTRRERKTLGAFRDGALVGVALCHVSGFPMNFGFLRNRVEILVHPEAPHHAGVVRDLARAAIRRAALCQEAVCTLLRDPEDAQAAVAGSFVTAGKPHNRILWGRENEQGWSSSATAFERWYARIGQRHARNYRPSHSHLPEHL